MMVGKKRPLLLWNVSHFFFRFIVDANVCACVRGLGGKTINLHDIPAATTTELAIM